jgi:hypothetical protein
MAAILQSALGFALIVVPILRALTVRYDELPPDR